MECLYSLSRRASEKTEGLWSHFSMGWQYFFQNLIGFKIAYFSFDHHVTLTFGTAYVITIFRAGPAVSCGVLLAWILLAAWHGMWAGLGGWYATQTGAIARPSSCELR